MDDRRVGLIIRALRRRRGWRQSDLGEACGLSQAAVSLAERGHVDALSLRTLRRILLALDARGDVDVRWRGGSLDRTLDERHAALVGLVVRLLTSFGWEWALEVTYSVYGERGSIDVLGFYRATASLLVIEVKTELTSVEETLRRLDEKARLAGRIGRERFGWIAGSTSRLLVMPDTAAARRRATRHREVLNSAIPAGSVTIRHWLAQPAGSLRGRWFLANINDRSVRRSLGGPDRVIRTPRAIVHSGSRTNRADSEPTGTAATPKSPPLSA
ncbi:MAG: XRE family transcriptional regulator [Candidatus Limnocylindrales bacterium]